MMATSYGRRHVTEISFTTANSATFVIRRVDATWPLQKFWMGKHGFYRWWNMDLPLLEGESLPVIDGPVGAWFIFWSDDATGAFYLTNHRGETEPLQMPPSPKKDEPLNDWSEWEADVWDVDEEAEG